MAPAQIKGFSFEWGCKSVQTVAAKTALHAAMELWPEKNEARASLLCHSASGAPLPGYAKGRARAAVRLLSSVKLKVAKFASAHNTPNVHAREKKGEEERINGVQTAAAMAAYTAASDRRSAASRYLPANGRSMGFKKLEFRSKRVLTSSGC